MESALSSVSYFYQISSGTRTICKLLIASFAWLSSSEINSWSVVSRFRFGWTNNDSALHSSSHNMRDCHSDCTSGFYKRLIESSPGIGIHRAKWKPRLMLEQCLDHCEDNWSLPDHLSGEQVRGLIFIILDNPHSFLLHTCISQSATDYPRLEVDKWMCNTHLRWFLLCTCFNRSLKFHYTSHKWLSMSSNLHAQTRQVF